MSNRQGNRIAEHGMVEDRYDSVENFIYLMVKCGVDIEIKEVSDEIQT